MSCEAEVELTHQQKALVLLDRAISKDSFDSRSRRSLIEEAAQEIKYIKISE